MATLVTDLYRLAPTDGVLEYKVVLSTAVIWVPVIPEGAWRYWIFLWAHGDGALACHRTANETFQVLRRAAHWPGIQTSSDKFVRECSVCLQYRSQPLQPPYRSPLADDAATVKMPWQDVVIDVQGPFTKAEGGEQYVLSYCCTRLKVLFLEAPRALSTEFF